MAVILPTTSTASDSNYPRILDRPGIILLSPYTLIIKLCLLIIVLPILHVQKALDCWKEGETESKVTCF